MTARYVLTYSSDGIGQAKRKIAKARSTKVEQPQLKAVGARHASESPTHNPTLRFVVGVWSLEAWLGGLDRLIEKLNRAQSTFVFYEVDAAVPAGLISRPERIIAWYEEAIGQKPGKHEREHLEDNLIAEDFFGIAENIRTDLNLDYIIGVTPSMVAGFDEDGLYWNHFSTFDGRTLLASSYQLHEFARDTSWPLEAFLGKIIVSQLLVAALWPKLGFHDDTGCLFDYDESRVSLKDKVAAPHIDAGCLKTIKPAYRRAAVAFVEMLRSYARTK